MYTSQAHFLRSADAVPPASPLACEPHAILHYTREDKFSRSKSYIFLDNLRPEVGALDHMGVEYCNTSGIGTISA